MASSISTETQLVAIQVLRNELILESIFRNVAIRDLKMYRLVESKWNQLALKEIQRQNLNAGNIMKLDLFEPYLNFFRDIPENLPYLCHRLHDECNMSRWDPEPEPEPENRRRANLERDYCQTFMKQIKGIDVRDHSLVSLEDVLEILGESLVELGVRVDGERDFPDRLKIMSNSSVKSMLPNLKSISVGAGLCENEHIMSECSIVFKNILSRMRPNSLEELNFNNFGRVDIAVKHLIEFNQVEGLKRMALYPNLRKGDLLLFRNKSINLQLKQFRVHNPFSYSGCNGIDRDSRYLDPEEFYQFLVTQKNTLQNLNLICSIYSFPPNMVGIKTLKILIIKKGLTINTLTINFFESFPNLRNLSLWKTFYLGPDNEEDWDVDLQIFSEQERGNSLRKLFLPRTLPLSVGVISRVLRIFPRLSSLELHPISCEAFQAIWNSDELADSLNVLILWIASSKEKPRPIYLENSLCLDHAFSGVTRKEIVCVHTEEYLDKFNLNESQDNSILKLKSLRKLHVIWVAQDEKSKDQLRTFTDFAALCVFDKMKNLDDLFIHKKLHKFSDTSISKLKARIQKCACWRNSDVFHENTSEFQSLYLRTMMST